MFQKYLIDLFLKAFSCTTHGTMTITLPDGSTQTFGGALPGVDADMHIQNPNAIFTMATKGDVGFAQTYRDGDWHTSDLTKVLIFGLQNEHALEQFIYGNRLTNIASRFFYLFKRNTLDGSKRNIHHHYDIGNQFYSLWLDPSMTYSSALFNNDAESLEHAQYNKYDRIIDRLSSASGSILEIGCGWGGFAHRAVSDRNKDYEIKGITISNQQYDFAKERLQNNANIALEDYRIQQGTYNHIVSIEMFEAVGESYWPTYFKQVKSLLHPGGNAVIQTISIDDQFFEGYRKNADVIRTYIFPGGMLPCEKRLQEEVTRAGLRMTDIYRFGKDYARTLQHWLKAFEEKTTHVKALGMDDPFIRIWRFYLSACIASFTVNRTNVLQIELQHA